MKRQIQFILTLCVVMLLGCLAGCGQRASQDGSIATGPRALSETTNVSAPVLVMVAENGEKNDASYGEQFKPYEQFGMTYDANKNELYYNGKLVRWFEDYYPIADNSLAGNDFFNENGAVDVYAVRDLSSFVRFDDGSFDPSGKLAGLKEFSEEEFDARDIDAIKNPKPEIAITGDPVSDDVINTWLIEYKDFGVTYDKDNDQWYFNGEKVRYFRDVLTSNGESLTGGKFHGAIRTLGNGNGTVDIYTIRDFNTPNSEGNGSLTDIKAYSQQEFDEHTQGNFSSNGS
ncbi:MAG: hypothetical protein J1E83_02860 [Lachnospiraceae bacterium]|nr:hypothetical protein [Lachnospiraceae bacterium]